MGNANLEEDQTLFIENDMLPVLDSVRDLEVIVDPCLNFSKHINAAVSKANQRVYLLLKSFNSRFISLTVFALKVYILPLEYCSSIWSPYKLHDIDRIEHVQRSQKNCFFYKKTGRTT